MTLIGIYKITNLLNNKSYIGKSIDILERWKQHIEVSQCNKKESYYDLYCDFRKYGINNFSFTILEMCDKGILQEKEQYYIQKYNSYENGYNQIQAKDITKTDRETHLEKIREAINLLENTQLNFKNIADITGLSYGIVNNINICKSWTSEHNYKSNIRKESNNYISIQQGSLNHQSKLTEEDVIEIIKKLKYTDENYKEIARQFNVAVETIKGINYCKRWKHLSKGYFKNIRKEEKIMKNKVQVKANYDL